MLFYLLITIKKKKNEIKKKSGTTVECVIFLERPKVPLMGNLKRYGRLAF